MPNNTNYSSDSPIVNGNEDKFQRYGFSKRIAETIIERKTNDCIVIGIYGVWGEGKTSVINFIEQELNNDSNTLTLKFNPWRFSDEKSLLIQFYQKLATTIDANLKTTTEKVGDLLKKYSGVLSWVPMVGGLDNQAKALGDLLGGDDVDSLKDRIGKLLVEKNFKVVVFIDDIDRLDKEELHSIFRLVKLNADFSNVIYVLAFDEEMVASAIGERFGNDKEAAGRSFLEKIVQVPLKIPVALPEALKNFQFKLVEDSLKANHLEIENDELSRFAYSFTEHILPTLNTPRLAIRYSNTISFSIPLLKGEVNIIDLLLIEAIKIFYHPFYKLIKDHPDFFIGSYSDLNSAKKNEEKIEQCANHINQLSENLNFREKKAIKHLLMELFPQVENVFQGITISGDGLNWFRGKRISSYNYFKRYFTYAVIKGEISDIAFDNFLSNLDKLDVQAIGDKLLIFLRESSFDDLLDRLKMWFDVISLEKSIKLAKAIASISEQIPEIGNYSLSAFFTPQRRAAMYLKQVVKEVKDEHEKVILCIDLINQSQSFDFAYEVFYWLEPKPDKDETLNKEQYAILGKTVLERALEESGELPIFEKFPESIQRVFKIWKALDSKEMLKYLNSKLRKNTDSIIQLITAFAPSISSEAHPEAYMGNMDKDSYSHFTSIIDKKLIDKYLKIYLKEKHITIKSPVWSEHRGAKNISLENLLMQIIHLSKEG